MPKQKKSVIKEEIKQEFIGIFLLALALFISFCIWKGNTTDNALSIGAVGSFINSVLNNFCGSGKILVPILLFLIGISKLTKKITFDCLSYFSALALFLAILAILHLNLTPEIQTFAAGWAGLGGGVIGALMSRISLTLIGSLGSYIFWSVLIAAAAVGLFKKTITEMFGGIFRFLKTFSAQTRQELVNFLFEEVEEQEEDTPEDIYNPRTEKRNKKHGQTSQVIIDPDEKAEAMMDEVNSSPAIIKTMQKTTRENESEIPHSVTKANAMDEYQLPPYELMKTPPKVKSIRLNKDITDNVHILEETLESFGVKARVTQVSRGPSITRYELQPPAGVKVSRIVNLADDIALSLAAPQVRIEAPIPGKAAIGIEVPNPEIGVVSLREILETGLFNDSSSKLTVALGKDIAGNPIVADLGKMPHLLIAGATGSGKSVCMNSLIASILFKTYPHEVKMLMIDPKVVELSTFNGIPHLVSPVVTDPKKAASALRWAINEMESRYELFAGAGVKDIQRYNEVMLKERKEAEFTPLPYIVIFIDELADLMMVAPADVEDAICRLAQMARAAGIHLVIATQRPSVDVITGVIKANIPSRIAFAVSSQTDSRTILDMGGAEHLLGRGDMLFYPTGMAKPIRVQGVYVSEQEIDDLVEFLKVQNKPVSLEDPWENTITENEQQTDDDPLLAEAARLFIESGQASISLLQRRMRIGYNRAARIIDQLEEKGIVGGYEGSKPRAIKMTWQDYEKTFGL
ncbi:MAG: DNA translocase FtsK 4TM domain-containing protein [Peptococcia bacterium]|jgi:S-DNA-T family DNA segregation ATPase FtsK/SpoIIIE